MLEHKACHFSFCALLQFIYYYSLHRRVISQWHYTIPHTQIMTALCYVTVALHNTTHTNHDCTVLCQKPMNVANVLHTANLDDYFMCGSTPFTCQPRQLPATNYLKRILMREHPADY